MKSEKPPNFAGIVTPNELRYMADGAVVTYDFADQIVKTMADLEKWGKEHGHEFTNLDEEMEHFAPPNLPSLMDHSAENDEEWRVIPGFPDYMINEAGIVRGLQSLMDMPHRVRLWKDGNTEVEHSIDYLKGIAFAPKVDLSDIELTPKFEPKPEDWKPEEAVKPETEVLICKHCYRQLRGTVHAEGAYRGKMRCDPQDSMLKYGYNAEPVGTECGPTCLGAN